MHHSGYLAVRIPSFIVWIVSLTLPQVYGTAVAEAPPLAGPEKLESRITDMQAVEKIRLEERSDVSDREVPPERIRLHALDHLRKVAALKTFWGVELSVDRIQAEIDRMIRDTRRPSVLSARFAALDHDPQRVALAIAEPLLADRLIRSLYTRDARIHGRLRRQAETALASVDGPLALRNAGGSYVETEWTRSGLGDGIWSRLLERVDAIAPQGAPGPLRDQDDRFVASAVLEREAGRIVLGHAIWEKVPFDRWWADTGLAQDLAPTPAEEGSFTLEEIAAESCPDDTWLATSGGPDGRFAHTAVWTGSEMIVWGGFVDALALDSGSVYDPATDSWTATSTSGAPAARSDHTAVWTGTEMIVWGGWDGSAPVLSTGGRYDPATDSWTPTSDLAAPAARSDHTAVWTGNEMIVWGGSEAGPNYLASGGSYVPATDNWSPTSSIGAPVARYEHTAIWTGTGMIVWGGWDGTGPFVQSGGSYDPATDGWSATSTVSAPSSRWHHTAVWTGSEMIVWGGEGDGGYLHDGGKYDPAADGWSSISIEGAPESRDNQSAVWTGTEMIVWGGWDDLSPHLDSGGRYEPVEDAWSSTTLDGAPSPRYGHTAVWAEPEMIVWGGSGQVLGLDTGGRYCAAGVILIGDLTLAREGTDAVLSWTAAADESGYDVVRGDLTLLRSTSGDYESATELCMADDLAETSLSDPDAPAVENGFWYLVRPVFPSWNGTFDSGGNGQVAGRDAGVDASPDSCP